MQGGSDGKSPPAVQDMGSIPGSESSSAEEKATHSSILAWRIPWTEKPDGLQSMRLHRVRALCEANRGHSRSAGGDRQHLEKVCVQCALVMMGECCDCQI